jgi:hypothetical protein
MSQDAVARLNEMLHGWWLDRFLSTRPCIDPSAFRVRSLDLTPFEAAGFMYALDFHLVEIDEGAGIVWPRMHERLCPFHEGRSRDGRPPGINFARECFATVAAAVHLHAEYGWPVDNIVLGSSRASRFDLGLFTDDCERDLVLAGEVKSGASGITYLLNQVRSCASEPRHLEDIHKNRDPHRKFEGLLRDRPQLLWLIAPATDEMLVVQYERDTLSLSIADSAVN